MPKDLKKKALEDRIKAFEEALVKAREYLENGSHAHWHGFRPMFVEKRKGREFAPPHKDWVENVFIPSREKAIRKAEKILDRQD